MSTIDSLYNQDFEVYGTHTTDPKGTDTASMIDSGLGFLRPVTDKAQLFVQDNWGREFTLWCSESTNIKEGNTVNIGGVTYSAQGFMNFQDPENGDSHLQVRLYKI